MPLSKKMRELKLLLSRLKDSLMEDKSIQQVLGDNIEDEVLSQYIDYVISDLLEMAEEKDLDKWELGRRILPYIMIRIVGTEEEEEEDDLFDEKETKEERMLH